MAELLINGQDAATLGIRMGIGFIDALDSPLEIKERIVSESRLEDGAHIVPTPVRFKSRSLSLEFILMGSASPNRLRLSVTTLRCVPIVAVRRKEVSEPLAFNGR